MMLIGVDYHPSFQTIAFFVEETGEYGEQELNHSDGQAEKFYRDLKQRGICVRVGMEATGHSRWFERLLAELGFELWIGDPAEITFPFSLAVTADLLASQLLYQAVLMCPVDPFHSSLRLRRAGRDQLDPQLRAHAPKLR